MVCSCFLIVPTAAAFEEEQTAFSWDSIGDGTQTNPLEEDQKPIDDLFGQQIILGMGFILGGGGGSALYEEDTLLASTLLGGERSECINDLVIGRKGKFMLPGNRSPDFPKTAGSYACETVLTLTYTCFVHTK